MTVLQALLSLGCQASMMGDTPQTEQEYMDRVVIHTGERPPWTQVQQLIATPQVPAFVPMWKAKTALAMAGKLSAANAAVSASGNDVVMLAWEYAADIHRDSVALQQMAAALNLTESEVDQLFIAANAIVV